MEKPTVKAKVKNAMVSMQKAQLVTEFVKGMDVTEALNTLRYINKKAALLVGKVIASAASNAEENKNWDIDDLKIVDIQVGPGITYKRGKIGARGRGKPWLRRRSNILVVLGQKEGIVSKKQRKSAKVANKAKLKTKITQKKDSHKKTVHKKVQMKKTLKIKKTRSKLTKNKKTG